MSLHDPEVGIQVPTSTALVPFGREDLDLEPIQGPIPTSKHEIYLGMSGRTLYDDQRAAYSPSPAMLVLIMRAIKDAAKSRFRVLSSTLATAIKHTDLIAKLKYKPQGCGWDDVVDCIAAAKACYNDKGKRNKVRAWSRRGSITADLLKSLADMIPDEEGLSVLRQGLIILFQVQPEISSADHRDANGR